MPSTPILTPFFRAARLDHNCEWILPADRQCPRPPNNIPYLVDNVWEWLRPPGCPSRRHAVFASLSATDALESASAGMSGEQYVAGRIELSGHCKIAVLRGYTDAKFHPDVRNIPKALFKQLGQKWSGTDMATKSWLAPLFLPCVSKQELDDFFAYPLHSELVTAFHFASKYWQHVGLRQVPLDTEPQPGTGEVFFEPPKQGYRLLPMPL